MGPAAEPNPERIGVIGVRLEHLDQLFQELDPRARWQRAISSRLESYVLDEARTLPRSEPISISLFVAAEHEGPSGGQAAIDAVHHHFARRSNAESKELRRCIRQGARSLAFGLVTLALCLKLGPFFGSFFPEGTPRNLVEESISILGWAANWRPVELLLYDWWPSLHARRLFDRLARADVEVRAISPEPLASEVG